MKRSTFTFYAALLSVLLPLTVCAQSPPINHKPIFVNRVPRTLSGPHSPNIAYQFLVSAFDPDGDTLTYAWRIDDVLVKSGRDTNYIMIYTNPLKPPLKLTCVFSDPGGLKDSTTWLFSYDAVPIDLGSIPEEYALDQNYPNPFNPSTTIRYQILLPSAVRLKIFNIEGKLVATLVDERIEPGFYSIEWKPDVPSGIYICRLEAGSYLRLRKMLLIK